MTSSGLRVLKHAHACVEIRHGAERVLVDPGVLGEPPPLDGVAALLVSHAHFDHASPPVLERAATARVPIFGPPDLRASVGAERLQATVTVLRPGDRLAVAGLELDVVGGRHARIHPDRPGPENLGYLFDRRLLVTGDEHPPTVAPVEVLITPVDAPWLRAVDLIQYVRHIRPGVVIGVHDGLLNDAGLAVADSVLESLTREGANRATRLRLGEQLDVDVDARPA